MLASVLAKAGFRVGLYTSPHLKDFRERIKINGVMIPEHEVVDFVDQHKSTFDRIKPSFFEMTVALAFDYFARSKVDIAVVEVGLGGRLDSTNIITPILSIITNIGMDHTDLLGDTIEKIALEKAGIIKSGAPVIISRTQSEIKEIFVEKAQQHSAPIYFADSCYAAKDLSIRKNKYQDFTLVDLKKGITKRLYVDLCGAYQSLNIPGVALAVDLLNSQGFTITGDHFSEGLAVASESTGLMGRWQKINEKPLAICDTGHNVDGIMQVVRQISQIKFDKLHMVIGMVGDKNIDGMLSLLPKNATYYFTKASIPRALDQDVLLQKGFEFGLMGKSFSTVREAYSSAIRNATENDLVFIGGSTFVVAEVV